MVDLDELYQTMMRNDPVEFEISWGVIIQLIERLKEQREEIKQLKKDIININSIQKGINK